MRHRRRRSRLHPILLLLAGMLGLSQAASHPPARDELASMINARRGEARSCDGETGARAGPLAPDSRLAGLRVEAGGSLPDALRKAGYLAARTDYIELGGPDDPREAMRMLEQRHCRVITDPALAEIGVAREGRRWRIVLARPLLASDLGSWPVAGREILRLTNQARGQARRCGDQSFEPVAPLEWDERLADTALGHSREMARENRFAHRGLDGSQVSDRAGQAGYRWRTIGENIAAGQGSAPSVVAAWLASPGHCANIMNPRFTEMGAAYMVDRASDSAIAWTQVLAAPRRKD